MFIFSNMNSFMYIKRDIYIYICMGARGLEVPHGIPVGYHLYQNSRRRLSAVCGWLCWAERMPVETALALQRLRWAERMPVERIKLASPRVGLKECPGAVVMQGKCLYKLWFYCIFIPCTKEMLINTVVLLICYYMFNGNVYKHCGFLCFSIAMQSWTAC